MVSFRPQQHGMGGAGCSLTNGGPITRSIAPCFSGQQPLGCRLGEHAGRPRPAFAADRGDRVLKGLVQDILGEKHQGVQGLPRGGGRHLALGGQVGEKALHLLGPEPARIGFAAEGVEIAQDPVVSPSVPQPSDRKSEP
jgi:hypothetical protein